MSTATWLEVPKPVPPNGLLSRSERRALGMVATAWVADVEAFFMPTRYHGRLVCVGKETALLWWQCSHSHGTLMGGLVCALEEMSKAKSGKDVAIAHHWGDEAACYAYLMEYDRIKAREGRG